MTAFSFPILAGDVPAAGRTVKIAADAAGCAEVADLLALPAVASLTASLTVAPFGKDGIGVEGKIASRLTQTCVASLEEFESDVAAPVDIRFSPDGVDPNAEIDLSALMQLDGEDPPDRLVDGRIDLGAIIVEFLALALDPYPRKPGSAFEAPEPDAESSPFAALKALRDTR